MAQHYSDASREDEPHALPDAETFYDDGHELYDACPECAGPLTTVMAGTRAEGQSCAKCGLSWSTADRVGWYYIYCFPGCLPDGEPEGPYNTEAEAIAAMREEWENGQ